MTNANNLQEVDVPIEQMARLIKSLNRQQKIKLLQLVPELQTLQLEEVELPDEQIELVRYFQEKMEEAMPPHFMQQDDIFLAGLTVAEFFALPEAKQAAIWEETHLAAEQALKKLEYPVSSDALPA